METIISSTEASRESFRVKAMLRDPRWISNSAEADTFLVFANVDPSKGYKGITCFVMSKDQGVQIAKKEKKVGRRDVKTLRSSLGSELPQLVNSHLMMFGYTKTV